MKVPCLPEMKLRQDRLIERKSTQPRDPREHVIKHIDETVDESLINDHLFPVT